jgi:hypothetical protein
MIEKILPLILFVIPLFGFSQEWQQYVHYRMDIEFDVTTHRYEGHQLISYINNSPDTISELYFHLYLNAFQPGSMMDVRSRTIIDPDPRIADRIYHLNESEIGFQKIRKIEQEGKPCSFKIDGTLLRLELETPILPGTKCNLVMEYHAQVPVQIRRTGRNNQEGVAYSMTQWFPKVCAYDELGWHTDPYISREFYSSFGDYEVNITIDSDFVLAGTGTIKNANTVGHGYETVGAAVPDYFDKLCWKFEAKNVHDFAWAADEDFKVEKQKFEEGPEIFYVFQASVQNQSHVDLLQSLMPEALKFTEVNFGKYPYPVFSFIQGGDGGMEYPMATLMTFNRTYGSFLGTAFHELLHSWYYGVIANNELLYAWMDEGFSNYTSDLLWQHLVEKDLIPNARKEAKFSRLILEYADFKNLGIEEPLSTHADHFQTNYTYSYATYLKGEVFLIQLRHMIGDAAFNKSMLAYFNHWKFRHPKPTNFIKIVEENSNMNLDWYLNFWINTTCEIDYSVDSVFQTQELARSHIYLSNKGSMPMPVDVYVEYENQSWELVNVPIKLLQGVKPNPFSDSSFSVAQSWAWVNPSYQLSINTSGRKISKVIVDPEIRIADINRSNNLWETPQTNN